MSMMKGLLPMIVSHLLNLQRRMAVSNSKVKKPTDLCQKPKHFVQPLSKIIPRKPAASKKKNENKNMTTSSHSKHAREAQIATQAKSTTSPVTRSDTSNKWQKGGR
jgi:hypothetical protein